MRKKLEKGLQSQLSSLIPQMFFENEIYLGLISEVNSEFIIVDFTDGGKGKLFLRDFISLPVFMIGTEVEVRIAHITAEHELILEFTSLYMREQNILQIEYEAIVLLTSHSAVAIYIPELNKIGLRHPKELKKRYQMMLPNQCIKCRAMRIGEEIVINKVTAIIRDGKEIKTFDNDVYTLAISQGSRKSCGGFRLGYIYEAKVLEDNIVMLSDSSITLEVCNKDLCKGDLLEVRLIFIADNYYKVKAEVISVLKHGSGNESVTTWNGYKLGELYKAKLLHCEEDAKVEFNDGTLALVSNASDVPMGHQVMVRLCNINTSRDYLKNIPLEVEIETDLFQ